MRANPTPAEQKLWLALRANRFENCQFTRQSVIAPYIVDFACKSRKLVIEVDGDTHPDQDRYEMARTDDLAKQGYRVIRFSNAEVIGNLEGVLSAIADALRAPSPCPLPSGEREKR